MRFYIHCPCGNEILCTDKQIGRRISCFRCDVELVVEAPQEGDDSPPVEVQPLRLGKFQKRDLAMETHLRCIGISLQVLATAQGVQAAIDVFRGEIAGAVVGVLSTALQFYLGRLLARFSKAGRSTLAAYVGIALVSMLGAVGLSVTTALRLYGRRDLGFGVSDETWLVVLFGGGMAANYAVACGILLWVLLSTRARTVCSPRYTQLIPHTPELQPRLRGSPFFWIGAFLLLLAIIGWFL
ncbi:MAG: hypothetical protein HYY93_00315 [Planctomycetes bacterium]|nr:hypothetical protein [Planctomycetota bacterium]